MAIETSVRIRAIVEGLGQVQSQFNRLGQNLTRVGRNLSLGLTAPLAAFGVAGVTAFNQQAQAIAQVEAGLASTGNQAGRTSEQLQELASSLQENSLFGDEDILSGVTAQLLTFTNITTEQFDRTQQAALDLAARLGGDLQSTAIQLGRALNDPVANLSALSRSGIQFSNEQSALINSLVETNNLAEAQNVILEELERQYGGSAAAAAAAGTGPITQLRMSIGDLSESFGQVISEAILPFASFLRDLVRELQGASPETRRLITVFVGLTAALGPALIVLGRLSVGISSLIGLFRTLGITARLTSITLRGAFIATGVGAIVVGIGLLVERVISLRSELGSFSAVFEVIELELQRFALQARGTFETAGQAIGNFFRRAIGREEIRTAADDTIAEIAEIDRRISEIRSRAAQGANDQASSIAPGQSNAQAEEAARASELARQRAANQASEQARREAAARAIEIERERVAMIAAIREADNASVLAGLQQIEVANRNSIAEAQIAGASEQELNAVRIQNLMNLFEQLSISRDAFAALNAESTDPEVTDQISRMNQRLGETAARLRELQQIPLTPLEMSINSVNAALNNSEPAAVGVNNAISGFINNANLGLQNLTASGLNGLTDAFSNIVAGTQTATEAFRNFADSVIQQLIRIGIQRAIVAAIGAVFPGASAADGGLAQNFGAADGGLIPRFNAGGRVRGPGGPRSDSILARLSNGEFVVRASSVQQLGLPFLSAINQMGAKGLSEFMQGNISNNVAAARNRSTQAKRSVMKFQDGGIVDGDNQPRQQMPNLTINIENNSQARIQAIQPEGPSIQDQIRGIVYNVILEDAAVNGPLTRSR